MKRKMNNLMDILDAMDEWVMENGGTSMKAKLPSPPWSTSWTR